MGRAFELRKERKMKRWSNMAKTFTRISKDISIAIKEGGANPESNSRLASIIQNAKAVNMPKENIQRAISRATDKNTEHYKEILFEGYAPHGIAILIETATDNNNRTVANIRSCFNKCNGNLSTSGSVDFLFDHKCFFSVELKQFDIDTFELELIDYNAEEVFKDDDKIMVYANFESFGELHKVLNQMPGVTIHSSGFERVPKTLTEVDKVLAVEVDKLIDLLENDDDVQNVFHNMKTT